MKRATVMAAAALLSACGASNIVYSLAMEAHVERLVVASIIPAPDCQLVPSIDNYVERQQQLRKRCDPERPLLELRYMPPSVDEPASF